MTLNKKEHKNMLDSQLLLFYHNLPCLKVIYWVEQGKQNFFGVLIFVGNFEITAMGHWCV